MFGGARKIPGEDLTALTYVDAMLHGKNREMLKMLEDQSLDLLVDRMAQGKAEFSSYPLPVLHVD